MLTAQEVARVLNVSPDWVYRHKHALGGFQPSPGSAVRFSENRIEEIKEGKHAIPNAQREMAGKTYDTWEGENPHLHDKARSKKMGSRTGRRKMEIRFEDPFGLLA